MSLIQSFCTNPCLNLRHTLLTVPFKKPGLNGLALAFKNMSRAKAIAGPGVTARLGLAYLGPAWPSPWPEARPGTALGMAWPCTRTFGWVSPIITLGSFRGTTLVKLGKTET